MTETSVGMGGLKLLLADLTAGNLALATVHLFVNDVDPGINAVIGDFIEATFTGSTAIAVGAWGTPILLTGIGWEVLNALLTWTWTALGPETVYGIYIRAAGGGTPLLGYARLDAAKTMQAVGDSIVLVPRFRMTAQGFGAFVEVL